MQIALIEPGKPWQNGTTESFNGKFRDECLSMEWFRSRVEAKVVIETWRRHYNHVRPHSSLGYLTPAAFAAKLAASCTNAPAASGLHVRTARQDTSETPATEAAVSSQARSEKTGQVNPYDVNINGTKYHPDPDFLQKRSNWGRLTIAGIVTAN